MTPPINSVSPERLAQLILQLRENIRLMESRLAKSAIPEESWDTAPALEDARLKLAMATELAARRAANTPVGPELWGKYPDTGVWHQIADGTNTDEQVADFERCYAEAGWTELRRSNPFASPALPSQVVGLSIKPLEWGDHDSLSIIAHTVLGPYLVEVINSPRVALWLPNMTGQARKMIEGFDSVEDAKAAAQADFNARIQACLTSPAAELKQSDRQADIAAATRLLGANTDDPWTRDLLRQVMDTIALTLGCPSASREVTGETLLHALIALPHVITAGEVIFRADPSKPGNATAQIHAILDAALLAALPEREG